MNNPIEEVLKEIRAGGEDWLYNDANFQEAKKDIEQYVLSEKVKALWKAHGQIVLLTTGGPNGVNASLSIIEKDIKTLQAKEANDG